MTNHEQAEIRFVVRGEWDKEPRENIVWEWAGLTCMIRRHWRMGNLCGYVGVPPEHPWYGFSYGKAFCDHKGCSDHIPEAILIVHGGVTFSGRWPDIISPTLWWFGFDCAHSGDYTPPTDVSVAAIYREVTGSDGPNKHQTYRNLAYVTEQVQSLASQLAAIAGQGKFMVPQTWS